MSEPPYERARETVNPDRLLPGEAEAGTTPAAAAVWVGVYRELLATKLALTDRLRELLPIHSEVARRELVEFDLTIIRAQQDRFQRRLAYWESRAGET
jgi:hypothetical protein